MGKDVAIVSCVGGGPMERLARALSAIPGQGGQGRVVSLYSGEQWRQSFTLGKWGRLRMRLGAFLFFPLKATLHAFHPGWAVLVPTTNPFHLPFVMIATQWLHGKPVVPLVYDLYPDALEAGGYASVGSLLSRVMEWANRLVFRRCDGAVFIGRAMAEHSMARYGRPRAWAVLETGADPGEFRVPAREDGHNGAITPGDPATEAHSAHTVSTSGSSPVQSDRITFSYVGNMGLLHDRETMEQALPVILERHPGARVVIAASGPGVEKLEERWGRSSPQIRFLPPLSDQEWIQLLEETDVALVTLTDGAAMTSIPSKTFSAMAASCAICAVAPARSDVARVVMDHRCGVVVSPGDVDRMVDAAGELCRNRPLLRELQENARKAAEQVYDLGVLARGWRRFLNEVTANRVPSRRSRFFKRALDLFGSVAGLILLSPVLLLTGLGVLFTMGRPIIFRQTRPGLNGDLFTIYKFRTMAHPAPGEPEGPHTDALRMTRLGRFLRASSLDELPELVNVLKGEMSLVGPRPLLVSYLDRYTPEQARRHRVKPGITGWAQINGRNQLTWEDKFKQDVWYVDNQGFWLDLKILFLTVIKVLQREGVSQSGHPTMPEFMGNKGEGPGVIPGEGEPGTVAGQGAGGE